MGSVWLAGQHQEGRDLRLVTNGDVGSRVPSVEVSPSLLCLITTLRTPTCWAGLRVLGQEAGSVYDSNCRPRAPSNLAILPAMSFTLEICLLLVQVLQLIVLPMLRSAQ